MIDERTQKPTTDAERNRGARGKPDWSRSSGAGSRAPVPFDSYDHKNMEERLPPPEAFVRSLSIFLGDEMAPVLIKRGEIWRWNMHPGAGVLTLPFPRHWTFRRKGARDDGHPLRDHVIVGSWSIPLGPLNWWIAAAEQTATNGLSRERIALKSRGEDPSWVPRGFSITVLPPERNWMEPIGEHIHLLIAGSPSAFPALDPRTPF
jgi:hypothetical protein